jgi:copper homeostasis protein
MPKIAVEVCAFSYESCQIAEQAGAQRIELCGGLFEGGTTPSAGLISMVKKDISLSLYVMIRPRGGNFLYSNADYNLMGADIEIAKKLGADGVVLGLLKQNGEVDLAKTRELVARAFPMKVTFHRAIDMTPNPLDALELIIEAGCQRILTSGQSNKAFDGLSVITELVANAKNRIEIMAGSGVNADNAQHFLEKNVDALHLTGKRIIPSAMAYRKPNVSMSDIPGISEYDLTIADFGKINDVVTIVNKFNNE